MWPFVTWGCVSPNYAPIFSSDTAEGNGLDYCAGAVGAAGSCGQAPLPPTSQLSGMVPEECPEEWQRDLHAVAGAASGAVALLVTYPWEVAKVRVQAKRGGPASSSLSRPDIFF